MFRRHTQLAFASVALVTALSSVGHAADPAAAQALFDQGKKLMAEGKAAQACPKFAESQRLDPGVGTLLNLAACHEAVGQTASAWSRFLEAESSARAESNAQAANVAKTRADALAPKLTRLTVTVSATGATTPGIEVHRDQALVGSAQWGVPIPVDPGSHHVRASAPGFETWEREVDVKTPGGNVEVVVPALLKSATPPPAAATPPAVGPVAAPANSAPPAPVNEPPPKSGGGLSGGRMAAIGVGVLGLAGVTVGTVFGLKSMSKGDEADKYCDDANACTSRGIKLRDEALSAGTVSTVGFLVGGAGLAGAAALWILSPAEASTGDTTVGVSPGYVFVRSRF